jgi:8-oxo-dGTP diphosphatase
MPTVTAGILGDGERVLICQRRADARFGLKWEFPGGKVEEGETPEACLRRELREELAIEAQIGPEVYRTEHQYPDGLAVRLLFFRVSGYVGTPVNRDFERIEWVEPGRLPGFDFLEADRELVDLMVRGAITVGLEPPRRQGP